MRSTRRLPSEQPSSVSPNIRSKLTFPVNHHLVVTTQSHIFAWASAGTQTVFRSSRNGIVAARAAQDGSGVLAVADKRVVVLHDTKRRQERSWGLQADDDEVRNLLYTGDAKSLFLTTSLTSDIQCYSTEQSRLLSPTQAHASPPVALAASITGHLIVSASVNPPVIYLKNLSHNSCPVVVQSQASDTAVTVIAFHPERPNIFLLAFRDGTLAAYDATHISRSSAGTFANQDRVNDGQIGHFPNLHRTTLGPNAAAITDAAFLPGYKTRAITGGSDGRCRLIDFADGGIVLRTWHAQAPVTSISVLAQKLFQNAQRASTKRKASHEIGGPTSTDNLIAVGREDGKVHLYDTVGLLLESKPFSEHGEKIISVEWVKGRSPEPIVETVIEGPSDHLHYVGAKKKPTKEAGTLPTTKTDIKSPARVRRDTMFEHIGLPPSLRKPKQLATSPDVGATRKFTIHPDEVEEGTIRYTPLRDGRKQPTIKESQYLDLFSPVKPSELSTEGLDGRRMASPPRLRPRVSPQTFVKSSPPTASAADSTVASPRNLNLFPSTDSGSDAVEPTAQVSTLKKDSGVLKKVSPTTQRKRITFKSTSPRRSRRTSRKSGSFLATQTAPNKNASLLADLRKLDKSDNSQYSGGVLTAFGPVNHERNQKVHGSSRGGKDSRLFKRPIDHVETERDSDHAFKAYDVYHERHAWPTDSHQGTSLDGDIWLTSESDNETQQRHRRRRDPIARPPARQTSRSRLDSRGTLSTVANQPAPVGVPVAHARAVDGSTEEEMWTAETHNSLEGNFSPSSKDVRDLFPRSSSLSPRKRQSPQRSPQHLQPPQNRTLLEVALNTVMPTHAKSPWAGAKASKAGSAKRPLQVRTNDAFRVLDDLAQQSDGINTLAEPHCTICLPTQTKVQGLEREVSRLKGEVLLLKAALRHNDIPCAKTFLPR